MFPQVNGRSVAGSRATRVVHVGCRVSAAPDGVVELGHELAVGRACGGEVLVAFIEPEAQVDDLLLKLAVLLGEAAGIGGRGEPGLLPGLLAERLGQAVFELPDAAGEPESPLVGGGQVGLQGGAGDARPAGLAACGRGGFEGVDLGEQVAVPVEEAAVDSGFSELGRCARNCLVRAYLWPPASLMALVTR